MVQRVHDVDLTDEILQSVGLTEHICLQTLHSHVQLKKKMSSNIRFCFSSYSKCLKSSHENPIKKQKKKNKHSCACFYLFLDKMQTSNMFHAKELCEHTPVISYFQHVFVLFFKLWINGITICLLTTFPAGVNHSPLFTTPNEPSPSFSNSVKSFSGMRQVRPCCCPSRRVPPLGCVARTPSPTPRGGVGDSLRNEEAG